MSSKQKRYTEDFKREAVRLVEGKRPWSGEKNLAT
jgi:transposase-like protein